MARTMKTKEDRIAEIDTKIAKKKEELAVLEEKKHRLEHPISMRDVLTKAKAAGITPEQIAEKFGLTID